MKYEFNHYPYSFFNLPQIPDPDNLRLVALETESCPSLSTTAPVDDIRSWAGM